MPTYTTKYGVATVGPDDHFRLVPAANVPPDPPANINRLRFLGFEATFYTRMQDQYKYYGRDLRYAIASLFKPDHVRQTIIDQLAKIQDVASRDMYLYRASPALFPNRPDAPPDVPVEADVFHEIMLQIARRDGLDTDVLFGFTRIPEERIWACYGLETPGRVLRIKDEAFAEGAAYARQLQLDLEEKRKQEVEDLAKPPTDNDFAVYGNARTLLRQAIAKRTLEDAEDMETNKDGPSKRARFNYDSESDSDSDDSSVRPPSLDLDPDVDMDEAYNPQDAGDGTGMLPPRRAYVDTYSEKYSRPKDWERLWHEMPYEKRIHVLGPGMSRKNLLPDDEFALPLRPAPESTDPNAPRRAIYKGKGVPPRFETLEEAMRVAPDDYVDYPEIFDWEVDHGRAAPAVLPSQQKLPRVPFSAASRVRPTNRYDPTEPQDSARPADEQWVNRVRVWDPVSKEIVMEEILQDGTRVRIDFPVAKDYSKVVDDGVAGGVKTGKTVGIGQGAEDGDGGGDGDGDGDGGRADVQYNRALLWMLSSGRDASVWLWKKTYLNRRIQTN